MMKIVLIFTEHRKKLDENLCKSLLNDLHFNYFGRLKIELILAYCSWKLCFIRLYLKVGLDMKTWHNIAFLFFLCAFLWVRLQRREFLLQVWDTSVAASGKSDLQPYHLKWNCSRSLAPQLQVKSDNNGGKRKSWSQHVISSRRKPSGH